MVAVIFIFVVLPIIIVALVLNHRRYEIDKRTDVMLKAIECGVPPDSAIFRQLKAPALKRQKDKVQRSLITAIVFFALAIIPFSLGLRGTIWLSTLDSSKKAEMVEKLERSELPFDYNADYMIEMAKGVAVLNLTFGTLFLITGGVCLIVYFIRRKDYEDELAESNNAEYLK